MEFLKRRLRGLIARECLSKGIDYKCMQLGVERGESFLTKGNSVSRCVKEGVLMATYQQRLTNFQNRSLIKLRNLNRKLDDLKRHIKRQDLS